MYKKEHLLIQLTSLNAPQILKKNEVILKTQMKCKKQTQKDKWICWLFINRISITQKSWQVFIDNSLSMYIS